MAGLQEEIQAVLVKLMDAFAKGDAEAMAALYTNDCKIMPTGTDVVQGQQVTAKAWRSKMDAGAKKLLMTIDEVGPMGEGDTIYERSHYCFYKSDGAVFEEGKYVIIWKKVDGKWCPYIAIYNSNNS